MISVILDFLGGMGLAILISVVTLTVVGLILWANELQKDPRTGAMYVPLMLMSVMTFALCGITIEYAFSSLACFSGVAAGLATVAAVIWLKWDYLVSEAAKARS